MPAKFPPTMEEFRLGTGEISKAAFMERHDFPFFTFEIGVLVDESKDFGTELEKLTRKKTGDVGEWAVSKAKSIFITQVAKTARNKLGEMVTVGRALTNDLVIPHPCISKIHAFFKEDPQKKEWSLWDAGSTYGTTVEGERLVPSQGRKLAGNEVVILADSVRATFLFPDSMYDYMALF